MGWFNNLKIKFRLVICFVVVAIFTGIVGIIGITNMSKLNTGAENVFKNNFIPSQNLSKVSSDLLMIRSDFLLMLYDRDTSKLQDRDNEINNLSKEIDNNLSEYEKTIAGDEERSIYNNVKSDLQSYVDIRNQVVNDVKKGDFNSGLANAQNVTTAREKTDADVTKLINFNITEASNLNSSNDKDFRSSTFLMSAIVIAAIMLSILLGLGMAMSISKPLNKMGQVANKIAEGDLEVEIDKPTKDEIGILMAAFSKMISKIKRQAEEADRIANGDLDVIIKVESDKDVLSTSLKKVVDALKALISEMTHMSKEHDAGDIDVFVREEKFQGAYKKMAEGVNGMVKGHISVKKKAMACIAEFAKGNFDAELEKFPGKKAFINEYVEGMRKNLKDVNFEITKLIDASREGKLNERADTNKFQGDWAQLMKGLNGIIDAILAPIQEAASVLQEMSRGNLQMNVTGDYKGDHAKIKNSLNETIATLSAYINEITFTLSEIAKGNLDLNVNGDYKGDFEAIKRALTNIISSLNEVMGNISNAAGQVSSGAKQVSDSSMALSQGATEQASSIEELTASIEEISAQTKLNADNASEANGLAETAKQNGIQGNNQMKEMLNAMEEINESSSNISKIIKVIDEIAFQTNILALNAAVEAARAGQHGKGFAVVAEEVRNLAARSADAAKETTELIEGSIKKVEGGTRIATDTAEALNKIVSDVTKVASIVSDISTASNEQAAGISQINQGIMQVSEVVQNNSATSEESAAASEELAGQAELLRDQVLGFKLKKRNRGSSDRQMEEVSPEIIQMLENMDNKKRYGKVDSNEGDFRKPSMTSTKTRKISLSDNEFGKY